MYRRVCAYIRENQMIRPGDLVIAGVSGGTDSMAMLYLLAGLRGELSFSLQVVHVHHGIRGREADQDASLVEAFCRERGLPFQKYQYDVPALSRLWKRGEEETGRMVRREAFQRASEDSGLPGERIRIALAHNRDDLGETLLHNLCRGAGLRGLSSMRPREGNLIRPVLCLEKKEIIDYLRKERIPHRVDSTNLSDGYTRNRIRRHVMPLLKEMVNPEAAGHMAQTAMLLARASDYLDEKGRELAAAYGREQDGAWFLEEAFFRQEDAPVSSGILEIFYRLSQSRRDFGLVHVEDVRRLAESQVGRMLCLPQGLTARRVYGGVSIQKEGRKEAPFAGGEWPLPIPGILKSPLGEIETKIFFYTGQKIEEKKYTKWLDYDRINSGLSVRTRRAGDFLIVNKEGNKKKLSRCLIDDKVPKDIRDRLPLVTDREEVLWAIGGRLSEKYKLTPETKRVLELHYKGGITNEE
ncbi:MAG: tRNA lysidine(34) synthetase TilS [Eubacteriales bacterium]|nr:tRNA lysidine(34) synthetase TilS [Eubacteriales bacterium]